MPISENKTTYEVVLKQIQSPDSAAMEICRRRWDSIAKPLHSLGKLEDGLIKISGMMGSSKIELNKKALVIMCADNGVVEEGVTQTGSEVTAIVSENFLELKSCACVMAKQAGAEVFPVDIGINRDTRLPNHNKIAYGTKNIAKEHAMTREQAIQAIEVGMKKVFELKRAGYKIIATGEMGIGNTTTSSAVASVLLELEVEEVTGKGAGLTKEGLLRKIEVIKQAIHTNAPDKNDPIDVLSKIGGLDIAGMVGLYLGGAAARIPVIMDGFISSVAALLAIRIESKARHYILPSHVSKENAGMLILETLDMRPFLNCDMCLGEGTGAVALYPLLDMALAIYNEMSTFEEIEIEAYQPL